MGFERGHRDHADGSSGGSSDGRAPGRRTLTDGLPPRAGDIGAAGSTGSGAPAGGYGEPPGEPPKVTRGGGEHTVVKGDTLWHISEEAYGHGRYWKKIRDANKGKVFRGGHLIHPDTVLTIPVLEIPVLTALHDHAADQAALRDLALSISDTDYEAFLASLSADERAAEAKLIQEVEILRSSGMTLDELADEQRKFLEAEAARQGKTVGQVIRDRVDAMGYGGNDSTWWTDRTPKEKKDWERRFNEVVKKVRAAASKPVQGVLAEAKKRGGGKIIWAVEECEKNGAFGYTRNDHNLYVGRRWVEAAEKDPEAVFANIMHEMMGHAAYGAANIDGRDIMEAVIAGLPDDQQSVATGSKNSLGSAYAYMETEIFAELYEAELDRPDNPTDRPWDEDQKKRKPHGDVQYELEQIKAAFAPKVAEAMVRGLWRRVQLDARLSDATRSKFAERVKTVFGVSLQ